jgi:hypothetical protein
VTVTPPPGQDPISMRDVAMAIQDGGLHKLALNGRAMVMRGKRGIIVMSLESPNTGFLVRIEEV